jgi:hypothetical protein
MNLLLYVSCASEFDGAPSMGFIAISAAHAKAIVVLFDLVGPFVRDADKQGLVSRFFNASFGTGDKIPDFRLVELSERLGHDMTEEQVGVLPDDFDSQSAVPVDEARIECHRIEIGQDDVRFTALAKHGSAEFSTADIPIAVFRAIADGHMPVLKRVELAPAEKAAN